MAIFIVVVLGFLGVMMVTIGGMERATASTAAQAARAYQAAHAGVEWGVFGAINNTAATCSSEVLPAPPPTTTTFTLAVTGLNGFTVSVVCSYSSHRERSNNVNVFTITSTAKSGNFGDTEYVARTLSVTVTNAPPP